MLDCSPSNKSVRSARSVCVNEFNTLTRLSYRYDGRSGDVNRAVDSLAGREVSRSLEDDMRRSCRVARLVVGGIDISVVTHFSISDLLLRVTR